MASSSNSQAQAALGLAIGAASSDGPIKELVDTLFKWSAHASNVCVTGSWDSWKEWIILPGSGGTHQVVLQLQPGDHSFMIFVDGFYRNYPGLPFNYCDDGTLVNYLHVDVPAASKAPNQESKESIVSITFKHGNGGLIYVQGSWDNWKERKPMRSAGEDYFILLSLIPRKYQYMFVTGDGNRLDQGNAQVLNVMPESSSNYLLPDDLDAILLNEFMKMPGNELAVDFKFAAGSQFGSINPNQEMRPCTSTGHMLLQGFFSRANEVYRKNLSWGGCFRQTDMIVFNNTYCVITRKSEAPLSRPNILLDNFQLKQSLLLDYGKDGRYPPYFPQLFELLEKPPNDFDTNEKSRSEYLDCLHKPVAAATPPERMMALVNVEQFHKSLSDDQKLNYDIYTFSSLFPLDSMSDWQQRVHSDDLLQMVYMARRKQRKHDQGRVVESGAESALNLSSFLRVFFVHVPEHTTVDSDPIPTIPTPTKPWAMSMKDTRVLRTQFWTTHLESDLMIAHYFGQFVARLIQKVRQNVGHHPMLRAAWNFYYDGASPSNHS